MVKFAQGYIKKRNLSLHEIEKADERFKKP